MLLQVYRGILRKGGQPVAVKVQRPGVRESIALDIYILRWLAGKLCCLLQLTALSLSGKCQLFVLQNICMPCSVVQLHCKQLQRQLLSTAFHCVSGQQRKAAWVTTNCTAHGSVSLGSLIHLCGQIDAASILKCCFPLLLLLLLTVVMPFVA